MHHLGKDYKGPEGQDYDARVLDKTCQLLKPGEGNRRGEDCEQGLCHTGRSTGSTTEQYYYKERLLNSTGRGGLGLSGYSPTPPPVLLQRTTTKQEHSQGLLHKTTMTMDRLYWTRL